MKIHHQQQYRKGALAARDFLLRTQAELQLRRQFEPKVLRLEYAYLLKERSAEFQAGFLDALGAYMLTTLEGVLVDLYHWHVLRVLDRGNN
jgi:hypothetical protein